LYQRQFETNQPQCLFTGLDYWIRGLDYWTSLLESLEVKGHVHNLISFNNYND